MVFFSVLRILVAIFLSSLATALSATTSTPTTATPSTTATVYPGEGTFQYAGCYNETIGYEEGGGARALSAGGWTMVSASTSKWHSFGLGLQEALRNNRANGINPTGIRKR